MPPLAAIVFRHRFPPNTPSVDRTPDSVLPDSRAIAKFLLPSATHPILARPHWAQSFVADRQVEAEEEEQAWNVEGWTLDFEL